MKNIIICLFFISISMGAQSIVIDLKDYAIFAQYCIQAPPLPVSPTPVVPN